MTQIQQTAQAIKLVENKPLDATTQILQEARAALKKVLDKAKDKTFEQLLTELDGFNRDKCKNYLWDYEMFDFHNEGISGTFYHDFGQPEFYLDEEIWFYKGDIEEPVLIGSYTGNFDSDGLPIIYPDAIDPSGIAS